MSRRSLRPGRQWPASFAAIALLAVVGQCAAAACPKLLMFDGTNFRTQATAEQAAYWGNNVGVQGFFVNNVMASWQDDVGTQSDSALWQQVSRFQSIYSKYGVTDNFIKVALYKPHDWRDAGENDAVVRHFAHAAALARYVGFKGVALDLEPYKPTWAAADDLNAVVQEEGAAIGRAMHDAYPDMTLIVIKDVLHENYPHAPLDQLAAQLGQPPGPAKHFWHGGYALAMPFLRGLLSVDWSHVVIATEETYENSNIEFVVQQTQKNYTLFAGENAAVGMQLGVAPGLWPLGHSYTDKSVRNSPAVFAQNLQAAFGVAKQYVWIYGYGSAWQTDGPYGAGPVTTDFQAYLDAIHQARASCPAAGLSPQHPLSAGASLRH